MLEWTSIVMYIDNFATLALTTLQLLSPYSASHLFLRVMHDMSSTQTSLLLSTSSVDTLQALFTEAVLLCVQPPCRKGATRSFPPHHPAVPPCYADIGQPVLIGGSMGTASYVLTGTQVSPAVVTAVIIYILELLGCVEKMS